MACRNGKPDRRLAAVVRGDDDQRVIVQPRRAQARRQRADHRIDVLQLQQVPLIANRGGPLVLQPALVSQSDVAAPKREPLAGPQVDPGMVRQQHVQEVECRFVAGRAGADRIDEPGDRVPRVGPRRKESRGKRVARGKIAPALRHRRQRRGQVAGRTTAG